MSAERGRYEESAGGSEALERFDAIMRAIDKVFLFVVFCYQGEV